MAEQEIPPHKGIIYHLVTPQAWEKSLLAGIHRVPSLKTEGFIHCSVKEQVLESANKHYKEGDELLALEVLVKRVKPIMKWEVSRGGALFPHLYGPLELDHVQSLKVLERDEEGKWKWPD